MVDHCSPGVEVEAVATRRFKMSRGWGGAGAEQALEGLDGLTLLLKLLWQVSKQAGGL